MTTTEAPQAGTQHEFGYEWERYPDILPHYEAQFLEWIKPLTLDDFKGKRFLDAGCGIGRNSLWPLQAGASSAYAFDYDERTVAVAKRNLAAYPHCEVAFGSIYDLEFENVFDVAFSIGVIHHLAEPKRAIANMVNALKPGGKLVLWVYGREGNERYLAVIDPLRRAITARLPKAWTRVLAKGLTVALRGYLLLPHRKPYLRQLRGFSFQHLESIVFDQLLPSIANYWRRDEVLDLVAGLPLTNVQLRHTNGMSWTLVAEKAS